ncbi:hypothetical protein BGZ65_011952 [Modicella reniformis]|uniref:Ornithine decarboxylase antizyme n=1 Tax=Modicella reniformis TaxID=1440133 RepID=A0A9P6MJV6_9FUNG|nr:hypothetical protein BGZ65_011952 [Modicella reniformis]
MEDLDNSNTTTTAAAATTSGSIMTFTLPLDSFASTPVASSRNSDILAVCFVDETSRGTNCYYYSTCRGGSGVCEQSRGAGISGEIVSFVKEMKQFSSTDDDAVHPNEGDGNGWDDMDIRESVVAALDLAEEQLECQTVYLCLEKSNPDLANLVRALMYAGFEVVVPGVLLHADPKYLVLGIEL